MLLFIRDQRNLIFTIVGVCLVLGIVYGLVVPVEYKSDAMVMPELQSKSSGQFDNLLQNYGGLLDLGGSSPAASQNGNITPEVYPKILQSLPFQHEMLDDTVYFSDLKKKITLYSYFRYRVTPFYIRWFSSSEEKPQLLPPYLRARIDSNELSSVTKNELRVIEELRRRVNIQFDTDTGVMQVTAVMPDPVAAAQVCNNAINQLTDYLKRYRTQKARDVLEFANKQYQIGRQRFKEAQDALASFQDQNLNPSTAKAQSRQKYLQAEFDLAYSIYNNVAQKRVQARMKLQENTPVFKTLQAANVPLRKNQPRWIPIIIFSIGFGLVVAFVVVATKMIIASWKMTDLA